MAKMNPRLAAAKKAKQSEVSYIGNIKKEIGQTATNVNNAIDKFLNGNRPLPNGMKIGPSNVRKEAGQLAGAVLQGRRYDASGKQVEAPTRQVNKQVKTPTRQVRKFTPMPKKKK